MVGETNLQRMIKKMKLAIAMTVAATLFASSASAFGPNDLQKLKDTNLAIECEICDLTDANLSDVNLKGADLRGAFWYGANLEGAILCNTTMPDGRVSDKSC